MTDIRCERQWSDRRRQNNNEHSPEKNEVYAFGRRLTEGTYDAPPRGQQAWGKPITTYSANLTVGVEG